MATRKKKTSPPVTWMRQLRQRLTSRMACFVWGAIFGNAILSQPINPLNLLLQPPEQMLSESSRQWLEDFRNTVRRISAAFTGDAVDALIEQATGWISHTPAPHPTPVAPSSSTPSSSNAFGACSDQFPQQRALQVSAVSAQWTPLALCSDAFAVLYSGLTKTPMVVVEKLNRVRLQSAAGLERTDQFYADTRVPEKWRADLADYQGSGFDRGHLAAAANQPTAQAMLQSFALSNMVPQDPTHNRKLWSKLESDTRKYALRAAGNVFVFSGTLHEGNTKTLGRNAVWIPSHLFKLVYDEAGQRAWAYILPNRSDVQITRPMDYASFVQRTHWALLDGLPITGSLR
ncbi:DNA/RNA non-specific endonuclease [Comamonas sp. NoAH]|uniref:DNA/RNA non-specific endonuclease n=1 Tax=Comamonas halotolerans TaxID=3041496 RepID=UPI0024E16389|nr:DNA/RNA non-specific endonuclease [Comamonas sp. NoAH]